MKTDNCKLKIASGGFTLIEFLVVIAIIALLIGVLVPSASRSLSGNRLASDVEVLKAKIEETRLLAGSAQTADGQSDPTITGADKVGYYGLFIPTLKYLYDQSYPGKPDFYALIRLSYPLATDADGYCSPDKAITQLLSTSGVGDCVVERINLTNGIEFDRSTLLGRRIIGFRVPTQQVVEICSAKIPTHNDWKCSSPWGENQNGPVFNLTDNNSPYFRLQSDTKKADILVEKYTGRLSVKYATM